MAQPLYADCVITRRCNFLCKHCDCGQKNAKASGLAQNWKVNEELTPEQWVAIFDRLGVTKVWFRGIEPLLYSKLDKLLKLTAAKKGRRIAGITTNGWLIEKHLTSLAKFCESVYVSIDGWRGTHDKIRGVKGAFQRAYDGVLALKHTRAKVGVSYAITPVNVKDMMSFYDRMMTHGVSIIFNHYNFIHPDSCTGLKCKPTNFDVYNPRKVPISEVLQAMKYCKKAEWSPPLTTRKELRIYYRAVPSVHVKTGSVCRPLEQQRLGRKVIIAADGSYILSHRCWLKSHLGNALRDPLPSTHPDLKKAIRLIQTQGFPPPCQRLCCAGKLV